MFDRLKKTFAEEIEKVQWPCYWNRRLQPEALLLPAVNTCGWVIFAVAVAAFYVGGRQEAPAQLHAPRSM